MDIKITIENFVDICPYCLGRGKLKAMQMAMTYDSGTVRCNDTFVKCTYCKGTGRKEG